MFPQQWVRGTEPSSGKEEIQLTNKHIKWGLAPLLINRVYIWIKMEFCPLFLRFYLFAREWDSEREHERAWGEEDAGSPLSRTLCGAYSQDPEIMT